MVTARRLSRWFRKWSPTSDDLDARALWLGVGSIFDLSGQHTRRAYRQLEQDRKRYRARKRRG